MTKIAVRVRLQHRVSIDPDMGALYEWLASLPPATRAREVVYLVRLGAAVHLGQSFGPLAPARPASQNSVEPAPLAEPGKAVMADWDLGAMCTPRQRAGAS